MIQIANLQYKFGAEYQVNKRAWLSKLWSHNTTFLYTVQKRRKSIEMRKLVDSRKNWKKNPKKQLTDTNKREIKLCPQKMVNGRFTTISSHFVDKYLVIFHKTDVQTVILRCWAGLNLNWIKSFLFVTEEIQYHDGLRSRELGQAPILLCVPNS